MDSGSGARCGAWPIPGELTPRPQGEWFGRSLATLSAVRVVKAGSQIGNWLVAKTSSVVRKTAKAAGQPRPKRPPIRLGAITSVGS
ncbi:hypothetical protein J2Z21_009430 [Streptomyces griseochromogenes]|uniref:Uncharacterized protein n=1 Tax=Streptomyces griseochromogenes TaxID=68214 RepID=A0A1B1AYY0_9ACTN|nr:hypothetical protein AVL59_21020 [Streptomyces griseochromogenes]MBP2056412.1 hypothetical protein [Streptomyces griseochromogenes]